MKADHVNHSNDTPAMEPAASAQGAAQAPPVATLVGVVPERLLDEGEIVILAIKPSLWFILFSSVKMVLLVLGGLLLLSLVEPYTGIRLARRPVCQVAAALIVIQVTVAFLQWLSRLYVLTNRRVMRIKGVFNVDVFECGLTRIQNTFMTLAIHERFFGLGTIQFATAGTGTIEAAWININSPLEVHEMVRRAINQAKRGPGNGL